MNSYDREKRLIDPTSETGQLWEAFLDKWETHLLHAACSVMFKGVDDPKPWPWPTSRIDPDQGYDFDAVINMDATPPENKPFEFLLKQPIYAAPAGSENAPMVEESKPIDYMKAVRDMCK